MHECFTMPVPLRSNVMIDGAGVIDGGGQRWWEVWAAMQAGDRDAAAFLSKDRRAKRSATDMALPLTTPWRGWNCVAWNRLLFHGLLSRISTMDD